MLEFFASVFLIALIVGIIFSIITCIFGYEDTALIVVVCFLVATFSLVGMIIIEEPEPNTQKCECTCCSICDTELTGRN